MKKKSLGIISLMLLLTSCGKYSFTNEEYPEYRSPRFEQDVGMVVDGLDNEAQYKGLETLDIYDPFYKVTLKTKVYMGEHGMYFYNYVDDHSVFTSKELDIYANDGVEMHINVDPDACFELANLKRGNKVLESMLQIRCDVSGRYQTWVGNNMPAGYYEWTQYHRDVIVKTHVDGRMNKAEAAKGYSIEIYVPYSSFGLSQAPEKISFMPAFNNSSSNLDSERRWYTMKGMAHNYPSSWMVVNEEGFLYPGKGYESDYDLTADRNDEKFKGKRSVGLYEVDSNNENELERARFTAYLAEDGIHIQAKTFDKELTNFHDSIWQNDGVEFAIDTVRTSGDEVMHTGAFRVGFDIDNGVQTDIYLDGYNDSAAKYMQTQHACNYLEIHPYSNYEYQYLYCYEMFIPFESLGTTYTRNRNSIYMCFAVKSQNESTYIKNRRLDGGMMEPSDWLWIDRHYPRNSKEFFRITERGVE